MATITTPAAGVSPYPVAAAAPTVLRAGADGSTVLANTAAAATVSELAAANANTLVVVTGQAALNSLITTSQPGVFDGANVTINLEEQNFNTTNQVTTTTNYPSGNTGEIQFNSGSNSFASNAFFTYANSNVVTPGIRTDGYYYSNGAPFTGGGNAAVGNFIFTGDAMTISHANSTLSVTGNGTGNVNITANGNTWNFNSNGNLTFPTGLIIDDEGPNTRIYQTSGNLKIRAEETASLKLGWDEIFSANANTGGNVAQIIVNGGGSGQSKNVVVLTGNESTTTYSWRFGNDGNLKLPGNTFAVNYANGNPVVIGSGGGLPLANGTSNINIATANGNVTVTANTNNTWTFATSGNLVFPSGMIIENQSPNTRILTNTGRLRINATNNAYIQIGWQSDIADTGPVAKIYANGIDTGQPSNVVIKTGNLAATTYDWVFGNTGNLAAPGRISATNIVTNSITSDDSSFVTIEDGVNVTSGMISAPENISLTAGANTWTFTPTGNLSLPNGAVIKDTTGLAIGYQAGYTGQRQNAVAIGVQAGYTGQGNNAVAIGTFAGGTNQGNNSIILNATGDAVNQTTANTFTVAPVRNDAANIGNVMFYNATTKEITYGNVISVAGNITGGNINTGGKILGNYIFAQSGATSAYATKRVLQYVEGTGVVTYSNYIDASSIYITGYAIEIHVSPSALDDSGNGTIGTPVKTIARAQVLAAEAFETSAPGQRKTIVLHPGDYVENVTISTQFTVLTTHELVGKNTTLSGTLTITKGCTVDGLKMTNLVISADNTTGSVDIIGCTVTTAVTKTSSAYTNFRGCDLSSATLSITGTGSTVLVGGNYFTLTVNNAAAGVLAKSVVSMGPVTLTAGTLQLADTLIYALANTGNAITQSVGSVITVNNCQTLIPDLSNVARNSFGGFYSILNAVYDKANSTFAGTSLNSILYSQYINADRLTIGQLISATGNITGGNILTAGLISATGNITGNYFIGNGSQLTSVAVPSQTILPTIQSITAVARSAGLFGGGQGGANVTVANNIPVTEYGVIITAGTTSETYKTGALGSIPGTVSLTFTTGLNSTQYTLFAYVTSNAGTYYSNAVTGTSGICLLAGTQIALSDGTHKAIEHITYTDKLLSWDFDRGCYAETTAMWIKRSETGSQFNLLTFSDGTTLRTFDQHRIFNKQAGAFTYPMTDATPVGTVTVNEHGQEIILTNKQVIRDTIEYYNVITDYHMNLFSDSVLTSCRFNNIYPVVDMKFVKDSRTPRTRAEFANIPDRFFHGLRLAEQTADIETVEWYVDRLVATEVSTQVELVS